MTTSPRPSPQRSKAEAPAEAIQLHHKRLHEQWLGDIQTQKFFKALECKRVADLTAAASRSEATGEDNAKEHNKLVAANTIRKIIATYGTHDTYPYADFDASDATRSRAAFIPSEQ